MEPRADAPGFTPVGIEFGMNELLMRGKGTLQRTLEAATEAGDTWTDLALQWW